MRAHTNIKLKDRNALTISDFKGVDFSSSAANVQSNRASFMRNLINEGGVNKKRHGWNELYKLGGQINGIFEAPRKWGKIIHAGANIYWNNQFLISGVNSQCRSQAFYKDDKVYLFCGDVYVISFISYEEGLKIEKLTESDVYIPTTTISIDNDRVTDSARAVLEDINCLTKWRKNTLVGCAKESNNVYWWTLDDTIDENTIVTIEIETSITESGKTTIETETYESTSYKISDEQTDPHAFVKDGNRIGSWTTEGKIWLDIDTTPPIENQANITVTFAHTHKLESKITNCTFGALFGVNGNTDTLFLSGNADFPNVCFYSAEDDFTYFPNKNAMALGSDTYAIGGFARLSDSTLVAVKEGVSHEAGIYYITGSYQPINDKADARLVAPVYTRTAGGIGEGIVSRYCNANLNGDALILSQSGVQGIVLGENVARTERFTRNRSININGKLLTHSDLSKAVAICHDNRYYLAIDGVCYVADARHKFIPDDTVDNSFNYEWWYWDNIPARVWASIDGQLYFGTEQGQICVFDDKYTDRTYVDISKGVSFSIMYNCVIDDMWDEVQENDKLEIKTTLDNSFLALLHECATVNDVGEIQTDSESILDMHDGQEVVVVQNDTYTKYYVGGVDWANCVYSLVNENGNLADIEGTFNVLLDIANKELCITNVKTDDKEFQIKSGKDGSILKLYQASDMNAKVIVTHERNIVAEYNTAIFDFGTIESSKTLLKMSVAVEPQLSGKLAFGYETRNVYKMLNVKGIRRFTFDDFNFNDFSFDTGFNNSYSVRVNERNFNYIMFRFVSDSDTDCIINKFTAIYKINKSNRGVR
jgi:hypothetical protein